MMFLILLSAFAGYYLYMDGQLREQAEQRDELQTAIVALQPVRIQRESLMRLEAELGSVVTEFERRMTWSVYTDELASRLPPGVVVSDLNLDGQRASFSAFAPTLTHVAQLISNFTLSDVFREPSIGSISVSPTRVDFQVSVDIVRQKGAVPR